MSRDEADVYKALNDGRKLMRPNVFRFGKYKGLLYKTVYKRDPKYIDWVLTQKDIFDKVKDDIRKSCKISHFLDNI